MVREKVVNGLEETEIMLKQAVDHGGEMAVMVAFKCLNHVTDALALLKEPETVLHRDDGYYCPQCSTTATRIMGVQKLHPGTHYCPYCGQAVKWG